MQAATGLPAVALPSTQIVLRELQTLSCYPYRRPRKARWRVDAGCDRNGTQARLDTNPIIKVRGRTHLCCLARPYVGLVCLDQLESTGEIPPSPWALPSLKV
jgi:hypothetical protein